MIRAAGRPIRKECVLITGKARVSSTYRLRSTFVFGVSQHKQERNNVPEDVKQFSDIPGPKRHWLMGTLTLFLRKGGIFKGIYSTHEEYMRNHGPVIKIQAPGGVEVWISNPHDIATVHRADQQYPKRLETNILDNFCQKHNKKAGVFFLNGQEWYKHRSVLSKRMLRPLEINKYMPRLEAISNDMLLRLSQIRNPEGHERPFEIDNLDQELFQWSFESVCDVLFDRRFGAISENPPPDAVEFISSISEFLKNIVPVLSLPAVLFKYYEPDFYKRYVKGFLTMYSYSEKLIEEKMKEVDRRLKDGSFEVQDGEIQEFIPFLLASKKIEPSEICSSIVDTLFAGVDTTSNTMQWMLYLLSKNPDKQEILRKEVDCFTASGGQFTPETLAQLTYLKATVKETLRLYPVLIAQSRVLSQDVVLSGYLVPAGNKILMLSHAMGRSADLFDSPNDFRPERWLRDNKQYEVIQYASLPFGHGVRMCLGRRLAEIELHLLLAKIIRSFKLRYATDEVVEQYLRGTNIPDRPLRVVFEKRI